MDEPFNIQEVDESVEPDLLVKFSYSDRGTEIGRYRQFELIINRDVIDEDTYKKLVEVGKLIACIETGADFVDYEEALNKLADMIGKSIDTFTTLDYVEVLRTLLLDKHSNLRFNISYMYNLVTDTKYEEKLELTVKRL